MSVEPQIRTYEKLELVPSDYFGVLQPDELFEGSPAPLEVDVGCGDGRFLLEMAKKFPERNFLGIERLLGRVRKVCRKAERQEMSNLRVLRLESSYTVGWLIPEAVASRVHLLFPDPWPKKRHHSRRLVNAEFTASVHRILKPDGEFFFKTDHPEYFEEATIAIAATNLFTQVDWSPDLFYPQTDFEKQWLSQGKQINQARYVRR